MQLPDGAVDVVLATCVLAEMTLADQVVWRDEFYRLLRPGGIAVISTLGAHAATTMALPRIQRELLQQRAFDGRNDPDLQLNHRHTLCFASFQMPDAVRRVWGSAFSEMAFVEAGITCFHDVWVWSRPAR